jgi:hypothetical protein
MHPSLRLRPFSLNRAKLLWSAETYSISLDLHNSCAEAYYCVGSFERMDKLLDTVFEHAWSFSEKLHA